MKLTIVKICIIFLIPVIILTGCENYNRNLNDDQLSVVCCGFSQYDWTRNIVGNVSNVRVTYLPGNGIELHSYTPTANDIITMANSDIVIYNGGESSKTIEDILNSNINTERKIINCMEFIKDVKSTKEHTHTEKCHHHDEVLDEHIWLSIKNASLICKGISDVLSDIDTKNRHKYRDNTDRYLDCLNELDLKYEKIINNAKYKEIVFADRFPFIYLMDDYGIEYLAAFPGCSTETDASFQTIFSLSDKINETDNKKAVVLNKNTSSIASAIKEISGCNQLEIFVMDSMQSVTIDEINKGFTYLKAMEYNLDTICDVLN